MIAVASGSERQARLRALRASHVIDRQENGRGANVVIDPVGSTLQASLSALAKEGRLIFVGNTGGGGLDVELWQAMQNNQTLHGVFIGTLFERPQIHETVNELLTAVTENGWRP